MFKRKKKELTALEKEKARLLSEMEGLGPESKEYATTLDAYVKLCNVTPAPKKPWYQPSADAVVGGVANLGGIGLVLLAERKFNLIPSKTALGFVNKTRI